MKEVPGFEPQMMRFNGEDPLRLSSRLGYRGDRDVRDPGNHAGGPRRFAQRVVDAGHTVYMPLLFGEPMRPPERGYAVRTILKSCISRRISRAGRESIEPGRGLVARARPPCPCRMRRPRLSRHRHVLHRQLRARHDAGCPGARAGVVAAIVCPLPSANHGATDCTRLQPRSRRPMKRSTSTEPAILALRFIQDPMCPGERFCAVAPGIR